MTLNFNEAVALGLPELYRRRDELAGQEDFDRGLYNVITNAISHLEALEGTKQEAVERKQLTEEQKQNFKLPKDYNALFDDPRANDEILRLVQQTIDQVSEYYEGILVEKDQENVQAIRDLHAGYEEQISQLQRQNQELQAIVSGQETELKIANETYEKLYEEYNNLKNAHESLQKQVESAKSELAEARRERDDAVQKRDAAMREVTSLKAQIDELEQQLAYYKKPKKTSFSLNLSSGISDEPRIKTAREIALERAGIKLPSFRSDQPSGESFREENVESVQPADEVRNEAGQEVGFRVPDNQASAGVSEETAGNDRGLGFEAWAKAEIEALKRRVDHLYRISGHSEPAA